MDDIQGFLDAINSAQALRMHLANMAGASLKQVQDTGLGYAAGRNGLETARTAGPVIAQQLGSMKNLAERANMGTGLGDITSSLALRQMANGDAMDPMANFARYLLGQQSDPRVRL